MINSPWPIALLLAAISIIKVPMFFYFSIREYDAALSSIDLFFFALSG